MNCRFELVERGKLNTFRCRVCEGRVRFRTDDPSKARRECPALKGKEIAGPGTHLKRLIEWWGVKPTANCKCEEHAAEMDRKGIQWCRDNIALVCHWLAEEAGKRGIPTLEIMFRPLVLQAIANAEAEENRLQSSQ